MPRSTTEAVSNEEDTDSDRDREGYVGGDSAYREDGADGYRASEDKEEEQTPDRSVEPHGVDGRVCALVDLLDPT